MLAIDTNLIVRYLTGDHPRQSARARTLIDGEPVFVPITVVRSNGCCEGPTAIVLLTWPARCGPSGAFRP